MCDFLWGGKLKIYLERSEFLIATSPKKKLCVCACVRLILVLVGNVLCTRYVCTTLYDTRYVLCTRYVWYQVRIMYQIRMYHTCRCTINSTAVSLFVYSLVGGGTNDTNVPPVDAHVWRQLHLSAVARCSRSYCIFFYCVPLSRRQWVTQFCYLTHFGLRLSYAECYASMKDVSLEAVIGTSEQTTEN